MTSVCCGPTLLAAQDIHWPIIERLSNKQTQALHSNGNVTSAETRLVKSQLQLQLLILPSSFQPNDGLLTSKARATTHAALAMAQARSNKRSRCDVGRSEVKKYSNNFEIYKTFEDKNHGRSSQSSFFTVNTGELQSMFFLSMSMLLNGVIEMILQMTLNKLFTNILIIIIVHSSSGKTVGQSTHGMSR